jgi:hypothetical protein
MPAARSIPPGEHSQSKMQELDGADSEDLIRSNREFDSNEIDESDSHDEKHDDPRISTLLGITID